MYTYSSAHTHFRPVRSAYRRPFNRRMNQIRHILKQFLLLAGPKTLWLAAGRVLLIFCAVSFFAHCWLSSMASKNAASLQEAETGRYAVMDKFVQLRAERARLISPDFIDKKAETQLALHVPEKDQITHF